MRLLVLYGSQTGTAQDVAEQIWRESRPLGFHGPVLSFEDYDMQQLIEERLVVFVVATTGDGVEPDNMKQAWRFLLKRSLPAQSLQGLQFACLGLGDSSYPKFNYAAKKLSKRLLNLGATSVCPLGLCDDQHDYGHLGVFPSWTRDLWTSLKSSLGIDESTQNGGANKTVSKWLIKELPGSVPLTVRLERLAWTQKQKCHTFKLVDNVRTTAESHFQDVRFLRLESLTENLSWEPGDVLDVQPQNSDEAVNAFFELLREHKLNFDEETAVEVLAAYPDMPLPKAFATPITLAHAAKYVWDLNAKPRQRFFEVLGHNCSDELESEKLAEFCSAEAIDDLVAYVNRPRRNVLEVLQDFRHASSKLTVSQLFEMMPLIQPRSFSIASDVSASTLDLLVAVVQYKTILQTPRQGLCSNWLKNLTPGVEIYGIVKRGTMVWPKDLAVPLIMVGPGTGIAPFRSIIQHRLHAQSKGACIGPLVVFFGCRSRAADFHFQEDFEAWTKGKLVEVHYAFSRDEDRKVYVQHQIQKCGERLAQLILEQNAHIYVAGNSNNMPKSVREAFIEILGGQGDYVDLMIKQRRYQEETWA
ncbi:NADPH-dependent diflavin oxidoreductase 1 [Drosophila guanche]|uniref:NADPH-dependent diflavin oxidoreductase 1 n=1 Tax=Drosophila guanche TaxID=7266 RepID=A0A3B0JXX7_DROGU|nr:NADPH-dependent diflavin oxidoreductase 1 [Drosophila guanche]SPP85282.1 blast:NADPH-dependent diflavin oxidoreductase 1 [Drosophila guanche]